jgi:hypothetical protein
MRRAPYEAYGARRALNRRSAVPLIRMPEVLEGLLQAGFTLDVMEVLTELRDDRLSRIRYGSTRVDLMSAVLDVFVDIVKSARRQALQQMLAEVRG